MIGFIFIGIFGFVFAITFFIGLILVGLNKLKEWASEGKRIGEFRIVCENLSEEELENLLEKLKSAGATDLEYKVTWRNSQSQKGLESWRGRHLIP